MLTGRWAESGRGTGDSLKRLLDLLSATSDLIREQQDLVLFKDLLEFLVLPFLDLSKLV